MTMTSAKEIQIDDLRYEMCGIHSRMKITNKKLDIAKQLVTDLEHRLWKDRVVYEKLDRELAMIDGRFTVVRQSKPKDKKLDGMKLTREQIIELAKQFGLEIDI